MVVAGGGAKLLTSWQLGSREMERKDPRTRYILQSHAPVTYFLHLGSCHLLIVHSSMNSSMD
jgi:hypothetical protein